MTNPRSGRRLFYALWPDDDTRAALARLQAGVGGRLIAPAQLHLTMAFLGQRPERLVAPLRALLATLAPPPLTLEIDCYGYFSRPRIAWAGPRSAPDALMILQAELMQGLRQLDLAADETPGAFRPHVTLARAAPPPPLERCAPVRWPQARLALLESADGLYRPL